MRVSRSDLRRAWSLGLNWVVFLVAWFLFSAIIGSIENTIMNREARNRMEIEAGRTHMVEYLTHLREKLEEPADSNQTQLIDRFLNVIQQDRFFQIFRELDQYENHVRVETEKYRLIREQLIEKNATLPRNDTEGIEIVGELIDLLGDPHLMDIFCEEDWCHSKREENFHADEESTEERGKEEEEEDEYVWSFGHSLHFVSTVFTTLGYGMKIPMTGLGKFVTVVMILTLLPFFVHCIATTATNINRLINRLLGAGENYDDLEDLTSVEGENSGTNRKARTVLTLQGAAVLVGVMSCHLLLSAIYHYITTGWHFGDVLYYEFVSYSTIGFGDMVPEEDLTVAGSILKNLVVKIPACILLVTTTIRLWPLIS